VLTRRVGATQVVTYCCARAQAAGLAPGITLSQAQATRPGLLVLEQDPPRDQLTLERLARWALRLSPTVEPVAPAMLLADVTGCARLFGGEENIVRQAVGGLARLGFSARAAIADTVGAAWAVAVAGPDVCTVVPPEHASAHLAALPPAALRLDELTVARLADLGIRSIGDLLTLPRGTLTGRFGPQLVQRLRQALGEAPEPLTACRDEHAPQARTAFEAPLRTLAPLQYALGELLSAVAAQVEQRGRAVQRLDLVVYGEHVPPAVRPVRLSRPSRSWEHIGRLLADRLAEVDLAPGIGGLLLVACETAPWQPGQGALFECGDPRTDEALGDLLDTLTGRLGHAAVLRPRLIDDHQPEFAFRYESVATAGCAGEEAPPGPRVPARPTRLLARPVRVRAIALVPDGPPTWFHYVGREHVVLRAWGPERLETAWWRGGDVRRDYFRVATEEGEHYWLFRELHDGQWYVHGVFE